MATDNGFRCDCVEMTRTIKDKIDAKLNGMTKDERREYFESLNLKHAELRRPAATV